MLLSSLAPRVASFTKTSTAAMICTLVSHRLPCAAASATARRASAAPFPASITPARSFTRTRAQDEPQPESSGQSQPQQQQQAEGGSQLQPRASGQGGELSAAPFGGDLMDLRSVMPTPFRRMTDHMLQMQREMDSLMGAFGLPPSLMGMAADPFDVFDRAAAAPLVARRSPGAPLLGLARMVPLEVTADEQGYTVTAEVPGFDKSVIKVSLSEDGVLTMRGSHEETTTENGDKDKEGGKEVPKPISQRFSSFSRSLQLPDDADVGGISATTQAGVLTLRIPKTAKPAPKVREIPVA